MDRPPVPLSTCTTSTPWTLAVTLVLLETVRSPTVKNPYPYGVLPLEDPLGPREPLHTVGRGRRGHAQDSLRERREGAARNTGGSGASSNRMVTVAVEDNGQLRLLRVSVTVTSTDRDGEASKSSGPTTVKRPSEATAMGDEPGLEDARENTNGSPSGSAPVTLPTNVPTGLLSDTVNVMGPVRKGG